MNGQTVPPIQQENPTILAKPSSNHPNRKTFIYVIALLLVFFLGFISSSILPLGKLTFLSRTAKVTQPSPSPQKPTIDESKLPVSLLLLTNPLVYEWRGSIKGKMTKKDDQNFTLADEQGNSITITNRMPSGDIFKSLFFDNSKPQKQIFLKDIPLGSILLGDFFIFKGAPNTAVGSSFTKQ